MRRSVASLAVAASAAVMLTGCVVMPPGHALGPAGGYGFTPDPAFDDYDPAYDEFDAAAEEQWQEESRAWDLELTEIVAEELRAVGSTLPPAEGESLEVFRHVILGVGFEWCDRLFVDEGRQGDAAEHAAQALRYGWSVEEYRIVVEAAEVELCGY